MSSIALTISSFRQNSKENSKFTTMVESVWMRVPEKDKIQKKIASQHFGVLSGCKAWSYKTKFKRK